MTKMNPEIKARWVSALRSGEYKQARNDLCADGAFCCLGVLCDLYERERGIDGWRFGKGSNPSSYLGSLGTPPKEVCEWAGLNGHNPKVLIQGRLAGLASHNDGEETEDDVRPGRTFAEIADAIEAQL